jgi:hypothetical protein
VSFKVRFSRLYDLSVFKEISIFDMCQLGWEEEGDVWSWRRMLFAWGEEVVGKLLLLLQNVILQVERDDIWLWTLESSNVFSVRNAYNFLTVHPPSASSVPVASLLHKDVSSKVVLFGGCYVAGCLQRTIYIIAVFLIMILGCV